MAEQLLDLLDVWTSISNTDEFTPARLRLIHAGQQLLGLLPDDHERRPEILFVLANALYDHYEDVGEWDALETAIDLLTELIEDTEEDDCSAAARLSYLYSRCLWRRFMRGRNEQDLEQAIDFARRSVSLTRGITRAADSDLLAARLSNLGLCLFTKANQIDTCPPGTMDEAIICHKEAYLLAESSKGSDSWVEATTNLSIAHLEKYNQEGSFADLEKSVEFGYQILHALQESSRPKIWEVSLSTVAFGLQRAFKCFLDSGASFSNPCLPRGEVLLDEALKLLTRSVEMPSDRTIVKLENVFTFAAYIRELPIRNRGPALGRLYPLLMRSVQLLQDVAFLALKADQRDCLETFYGISRYAAAAAIEFGVSPCAVLQLLETGRAVALSIALDSKQDRYFSDIKDPELEKSYRDAMTALTTSIAQGEPLYERQHRLKQLRQVQERIRELPGMASFDHVLGEEAMKNLADEGVIVVINVTDIRSDAILVDSTRIWTLPLPELIEDRLTDNSWIIQQYLALGENQHEIFPDLWKSLSTMLKWLWTALAQPILDNLGYKACESNWPHIWWVPTGVLGLCPIHAIGTGLNVKTNVMDRVISSYTPSLKALAQARLRYEHQNDQRLLSCDHTAQQKKPPPSALVIVMHETPGHAPLKFSEEEAAAVQDRFPNAKVLHEPVYSAACQALQESPELSVVHFSCHGATDYDEHSRSTLFLRDWDTHPLTVDALQGLSMSRPQLAFLSACFTANAGIERGQDETQHLASAMQIAGFAAVVGSTWNIDQDAACAVVKEFYRQLPGKGEQRFDVKSAKTALHSAVRVFARTTCNGANRMKGDPVRWAPFVHYGV